MQSIGDTLQAIARQRGRGDAVPLIALRQLDGSEGERISHLPVDRDLAQAWLAMSGEPFRPHQAAALAAMRRGDPVALRAASATVADSLHLLLYATLCDERFATALILAPDELEAHATHARLEQINANLPATLRLTCTLALPAQRPNPYARVVVATPEALHGRLLRHHERAWQLFWSALRVIALPDIHRHHGVAGAHLADLLLRALRVSAGHGGAGVAFLATLVDLVDPEPALTSLLGQQWRIVPADDGPRDAPLLAVWHAGSARLRDSADLALALQRQGYQVHIICGPLEQAAIAPVIGDTAGISVGPGAEPAQVLISAGYPGSISALRRLLDSGYQAVVTVLGDLPHEQALARQVEMLISGPSAAWPPPPANAYVTAQHLLCAASEQPLTAQEVEAWGATEVVARLAAHQQLVDLPDEEQVWKPADAAGDPYADFSPLAASGAPMIARTENNSYLGSLDPTGFERWTFVGAALPPGAGGMRVVARDDDQGSITLRIETSGRRTYPLRRCSVEIRETRDTRRLAGGKPVSWGRVVVSEEITGYREMVPGQAVTEMALKSQLAARWVAPACWFDVRLDRPAPGQLIGWCLAAALPLRALAGFTDVVPCYDEASQRIFLVDAQPGGSGLAVWLYTHAEELLPLAYDIALACRSDPLLEPLSRADQDWLLALLGRSGEHQPAAPLLTPPPTEREAPPAATRRLESPPAPQPEPRAAPAPRNPPANHQRQRSPAPPPVRRGQATVQRPPAAKATNGQLWVEPEPAQSSAPPPQPKEQESPFLPPPPEARRPSAQPERPPEPEESRPDAAALIERLRRQRQQREGSQARAPRGAPSGRRAAESSFPAPEPRFKAGDHIFCLPYGDGVVRESRIDGGGELLTVHFPEHGELTIDPAVSLVRKLDDAPEDETDLL